MIKNILVGIALLLAPVAWGQQPQNSQALIPAVFRDFSGGLSDFADPSELKPNQSPSLENVVIDDPNGALKPRTGFLQCGVMPSGSAAKFAYEFSKSDGSRNLILSDGDNVYSTRDCVTFTTIKTGLGASNRPSAATVRNKLWMVNGSTFAFTWDGTTVQTLDTRAGTPNPAPPRCAYLEFWKERVWCARTSGDPSSLAYSALEDTSGNDLDPSTGSASWPATNVFYIDQDAGSPIYGLKAYKNRLYVFKDNGIWEIIFNSDFDNAIHKTAASIGSRFNTSIVELEGILYFVGIDGIYAFDGESAVRISVDIENKFKTLNQPLVNNLYKIWTDQADFNAGTFSDTTSSDTSGSITLSSNTAYDTFSDGDYTAGPTTWTATGGSYTVSSEQLISETVAGDMGNVIHTMANPISSGSWSWDANNTGSDGRCYSSGGGNCYEVRFMNSGANYYALRVRFDSAGCHYRFIENGTVLTQTTHPSGCLAGTTYRMKVTRDSDGVMSAFADGVLYSSTTDTTISASDYTEIRASRSNNRQIFDNIEFLQYDSLGVFTSDVFNAVTVSTWSTFDATIRSNGGSAAYQIRVGTGTAAIAANAYVAIAPGALITGTTADIYVQWKSSITAPSDRSKTVYLDDVTVNYVQGGTNNQQIYAARHDNRLWIAASSGSATTNNIIFVKSRAPSNAWSIYNMSMSALVRFNDLFYGASSTHSAINRLDYGTNDNGVAIDWHWQSRDEMWGLPNNKKYLYEILTDFRKGTMTNLKVGYSKDGGSTFTNRTVNANGTGRGSDRSFVSGGNYFDYRFRLGGSTLDETATITGLSGWARPLNFRE